MSYSPPPRIPASDISKSHTVSHTDKRKRRKTIQLSWQASIYPQGNDSAMLQEEQKQSGREFLSMGVDYEGFRINTKEHNSLDFSFSGYTMTFLLFRIHFKAMWNLLNKWQLILEEDLSKYLHIRRQEQQVAILERFFYQKLSKSIFIRIIRILSANRKVKSHNY